MNLERASIVIRPRGVLEVLDLALRFQNVHGGKLYLRLALVVLVPCFAITVLARWVLGWDWDWVWFLALGLGSVAQAPFTLASGRLMFSEAVTVRRVLWAFARRSPTVVCALFATRILLIASLLTIVLVPLAWAFGAFIHEITLLEGTGTRESLGRARRFVSKELRAVLGMLLAHLSVVAGGVIVGESLGRGIVGFVLQLGRPLGALEQGGSAFALAGFFAVVPLVATARFLAYTDARTRRDGWDIQVRFMALVASARGRLT